MSYDCSKLPKAIKGCGCKICRQKRYDVTIKPFKDRVVELEEEVEQFKCETFLFCDGCQHKMNNRQLKKEVAKLIEQLKKQCSVVDCELRKTIRELEEENKQLKEQLLGDERGDYWKARIDDCRKLMPEGSGGICLDTFIRSLLSENEQFKKENEKLRNEVGGLRFANWHYVEGKCCIANCKIKKENEQLKEDHVAEWPEEHPDFCACDDCRIKNLGSCNRKLAEENSQLKEEVAIRTNVVKQLKKAIEQFKKERIEIFEHVAKWLDTKAAWFRTQIGLESFVEEYRGHRFDPLDSEGGKD